MPGPDAEVEVVEVVVVGCPAGSKTMPVGVAVVEAAVTVVHVTGVLEMCIRDRFPTSLASRGLVGLGVFLFDPDYQNGLTYKCEGLGEWRGQAAWEIRFEERREVESRLMTWKNNRGTFPVALKGRVWVAANSYDLLHIETDLREPIPQLELDRDHLIIDYGPVKFDHGKTSLWLPWYAELYMQVHGKRYHHRHTLTNYALFSVDTNHQIDAPKDATNQN